MGAFNILKSEIKCPKCARLSEFEVQFKFGNCRQIEYSVGDVLQWGGNEVGIPSADHVRVEGIGGPCQHCSTDFLDFDIFISCNVIEAVRAAKSPRGNSISDGFEIL